MTRDTVKLGPQVEAMLNLAGVTASYLHNGKWMIWLKDAPAFTYYPPQYPNYEDFARSAAELIAQAQQAAEFIKRAAQP